MQAKNQLKIAFSKVPQPLVPVPKAWIQQLCQLCFLHKFPWTCTAGELSCCKHIAQTSEHKFVSDQCLQPSPNRKFRLYIICTLAHCGQEMCVCVIGWGGLLVFYTCAGIWHLYLVCIILQLLSFQFTGNNLYWDRFRCLSISMIQKDEGFWWLFPNLCITAVK